VGKTIVIADDHGLTTTALAAALAAIGLEVVAIADNGIDAIAQVKALQPACAVFDLGMPGANGVEAFLEAKRWAPDTRFAIVTGNPSASIFTQLLQAGISGLFLKTEAPEMLCKGIADILRGRLVISAGAAKVLHSGGPHQELTQREMQVLQAIAKGLSNAGIAEELGISAKTVNSHRTNLMQKMSVHSTASLLMRALKLDLISIHDGA
jgi:DNA-binding NarL/FixJ family response regulator